MNEKLNPSRYGQKSRFRTCSHIFDSSGISAWIKNKTKIEQLIWNQSHVHR